MPETLSTEQALIAAINANAGEGDRFAEQVYADWLLEVGGQPDLAEAWRVLIEAGKRPAWDIFYNGSTVSRFFRGWQWFPNAVCDESSNHVWEDLASYAVVDRTLWNAMKFFRQPTFHAAMNAAAIAWVRCHRDAEV